MSSPDGSPIESVEGGSHGVVAGYAEMAQLASTYASRSRHLSEMARLGVAVVANPDLVESALLCPASFAEVETHVLDATAGAQGLVARAIGLGADAVLVRATVDAFRASDQLARALNEAIDHALGKAAAIAGPVLVLVAVGAGAPTLGRVWSTLSPEERDALSRSIGHRLGEAVHSHPGLVQHLINSGGGLVDTLVPGGVGWLAADDGPLGRATTNDAARLLALSFGNDTDYLVTRRGEAGGGDSPRSVADLVTRLSRTNDLDSVDPTMHGAIDVARVEVDGRDKYIVYLPGTDDMSPLPKGGDNARDMLTNYQLIGGMESSYGRGISEAMREAGLAGKDVMLVGHSQGGMVATSLAADPGFREEFHVQQVLTVGSPTAQVAALPSDVAALHLENRGDAVPLLDGEDNPDQARRVTVKFDLGTSDVAGNHALELYAAGARAVDASGHGSIRDAVEQMTDDGFLRGEVASTATYTVSRG